jgi:hypothetical protein
VRTTIAIASAIAAALVLTGCSTNDPSEYTSGDEAADVRDYCVVMSNMADHAVDGTLTQQSAEGFLFSLRSPAKRLAQHRDDAKRLPADTNASLDNGLNITSAWGSAMRWCDAQGYTAAVIQQDKSHY